MADFLYNTGSADLWNTLQPIDLLVDTIKVMLCDASYVADRDDDVVDAGGADDAVDHEIDGTGYTKGWGNSGRKTLASKTITVDKTNDRTVFDCADVVWTAVTAGSPAQALFITEGASNDTTSRLLAKIDSGFPVTTDGRDLIIQWNSIGIFGLKTA